MLKAKGIMKQRTAMEVADCMLKMSLPAPRAETHAAPQYQAEKSAPAACRKAQPRGTITRRPDVASSGTWRMAMTAMQIPKNAMPMLPNMRRSAVMRHHGPAPIPGQAEGSGLERPIGLLGAQVAAIVEHLAEVEIDALDCVPREEVALIALVRS